MRSSNSQWKLVARQKETYMNGTSLALAFGAVMCVQEESARLWEGVHAHHRISKGGGAASCKGVRAVSACGAPSAAVAASRRAIAGAHDGRFRLRERGHAHVPLWNATRAPPPCLQGRARGWRGEQKGRTY